MIKILQKQSVPGESCTEIFSNKSSLRNQEKYRPVSKTLLSEIHVLIPFKNKIEITS